MTHRVSMIVKRPVLKKDVPRWRWRWTNSENKRNLENDNNRTGAARNEKSLPCRRRERCAPETERRPGGA